MPPSNSFLLALFALSLGCKDPTPAAHTTAPVTAQPTPVLSTQNTTPNVNSQRLQLSPASSRIEFTGRKVTASHTGHFERFTGTLDLDPARLENTRVAVTIEINSISVEPARLRNHLLTADLLDSTRFPTATFTSTSIQPNPTNDTTHTITGNLALHGQTRSVSFPARLNVTPTAATATAEFTINRRDFGIVYPGMPDDLIHDNVTIKLTLNAPRA